MSEVQWSGYDGPIVDELSKEDIQKQDELDNLTFNYLRTIARTLGISDDCFPLEWNIDTIMSVHEVARRKLYENHGIRVPYACTESKK